MYEVSVSRTFAAAHSLREYQGQCEGLHGHNWQVEIVAGAMELDEQGMVVDFTMLKRVLDAALNEFDHHYINEIPPFDQLNPSSENLSRVIFDKVARQISGDRVRVLECRVWESEKTCSVYRP